MNHILIEFPVFDGALAGEPLSKSRSPRNKNLDQLVGAAKALLDYYGPVVDELPAEAWEQELFHKLENALDPFLSEAAVHGRCVTGPPKPLRKLHIVPKPEPVIRESSLSFELP
jgi:hypothetical protein